MPKANKPKKENYLLRINHPDYQTHSGSIEVSAWSPDGITMHDEHIVDEVFPALSEFGLGDLAEGVMEYTGERSVFGLADILRGSGFQVQLMV